jgi:toxin ParE1/3/4
VTRRIEWSQSALDDFDEAVGFLPARSRQAARRLVEAVDRTLQNLAMTPVGRSGRVPGTYEMPVRGTPYIVAYAMPRDGGERLLVLRIIHGARDWRSGAWPE